MNILLAHGDQIQGQSIVLLEGKSIDMEENTKKKIYCFVNGSSREWHPVLAMCEDGHVLANHASSTVGWARHDIGITSDWKHENYKEHCPEGYELIWVDEEDVRGHEGIQSAYQLNQELRKAAEKEKV